MSTPLVLADCTSLGEGFTLTVSHQPPGPALYQVVFLLEGWGHWDGTRMEPSTVWWLGEPASRGRWESTVPCRWAVLSGDRVPRSSVEGHFDHLITAAQPYPCPELISDMRELLEISNNCHYACELKDMLALGKSLMVVSKVVHLLQEPRAKSDYQVKFFKDDLEKVRQARALLLSHMMDPPNLGELARAVGTNELKLKAGFQKLWNTTVFGLLRRERMTEARRLLTSGECNVGEAAFRVGYTNTSHFSQSFRREFGVNPRVLLNHDVPGTTPEHTQSEG